MVGGDVAGEGGAGSPGSGAGVGCPRCCWRSGASVRPIMSGSWRSSSGFRRATAAKKFVARTSIGAGGGGGSCGAGSETSAGADDFFFLRRRRRLVAVVGGAVDVAAASSSVGGTTTAGGRGLWTGRRRHDAALALAWASCPRCCRLTNPWLRDRSKDSNSAMAASSMCDGVLGADT